MHRWPDRNCESGSQGCGLQACEEHRLTYLIGTSIDAADLGAGALVDLCNVGCRGIGAAAETHILAVGICQLVRYNVILTWQIDAWENSITGRRI